MSSKNKLQITKKITINKREQPQINKEQKELEKECRVKTIAQGQDILVYGHTNDYLYVIVSGSADVIVNGKKSSYTSCTTRIWFIIIIK